MYRKNLKRLDKLNSVTYRLSLKQRDKGGGGKSELPVTSCVRYSQLSQVNSELSLLSPC